jgi:hypothetical protein
MQNFCQWKGENEGQVNTRSKRVNRVEGSNPHGCIQGKDTGVDVMLNSNLLLSAICKLVLLNKEQQIQTNQMTIFNSF